MQNKPVAEQEIGKQLLAETAAYAESSLCRRRTLMHYFGEKYDNENCGNCDNCLNPKKKVEAQEDLSAALETIAALKEKFKTEHVVDVMLGRASSDVRNYHHDELEPHVAAKAGRLLRRVANRPVRRYHLVFEAI